MTAIMEINGSPKYIESMQKSRIYLLGGLLLILASCSSWYARKPPNQEREGARQELFGSMYQIMSRITRLLTLSASEERLRDPENRAELDIIVKGLSEDSQDLLTQKSLQSATHRLSGKSLARHFRELANSYEDGNLAETRRLALATPIACASCHTQGALAPKPLWSLKEDEIDGTLVEKAELLFATRNYEASMAIYDRIVRSLSAEDDDKRLALKRKLTTYLRVKLDFNGAIKSLDRDLRDTPRISSGLRAEMQVWRSSLQSLSRRDWFNSLPKTADALLEWSDRLASEGRDQGRDTLVEELFLSGRIYETLNRSTDSTVIAGSLLRLASIEGRIGGAYGSGLRSAYLRECMDISPDRALGRRCYAELEAHFREVYTDEHGYRPPADARSELRARATELGIDGN
jgi:hypothetical protein